MVVRCTSVVLLGFDGGERNRVDDVLHQRATAQIVHRLVESLQDRADGHGAGGALHGLVADVARIEVGEHEHRDTAGYGIAGCLDLGHIRRPCGIELDWAHKRQVRVLLTHDRRGLDDQIDIRALAGTESGV